MQIKNFHIIRSLERNTLSELFLARHVHDNYYVKIRLYDQSNITNEEIREAILQRLRNAYQMRHRNIIATLDYGVEGRYMYQIQEHMDWGTLDDLLEKVSHVPPEIASFILQEILRGLQYAHSIGIFHGMLSPSRVLLSSNGIVKLHDFQFLDLKHTFLNKIHTKLKAKQQMYLAPEHLLGKEADYRCDIFSAGVIAYKMLTGRHPFLEEKSEWTVMQIIACNAKLLFELDPTLPPPMEDLVEKMIEKEPSGRLQSSEEALRMIDSYTTDFGEIRSYEVLANFLKKPGQSVDQLKALRADELLQQAAQFQIQDQSERALVAFHRARFLRPKDKNIENEIKSLCNRLGYSGGSNEDPIVLQLEQSLKANPDNIQVLQRLSTLAKSRGDLLECIAYHKRILKIHPKDVFSNAQLRQLLEKDDRDALFSPNETKWTRWQDFYRSQQRPVWQRWGFLQGNISLIVAVFGLAVLIAALHTLRWIPVQNVDAAPPYILMPATQLVSNQKINQLCEQAASVYSQGAIREAIEILSKAPLPEKGASTARARLLLARYYLETELKEEAMETLEKIDLPSADLKQRVEALQLKAEIYRRAGKYGYAIDQYMNIEVMPGLSAVQRSEASAKVQELQDEALQLQLEKQELNGTVSDKGKSSF
ncbi:protein kinase [bacterium]|nr:protein kinase [bacterium]